MVYRPMTFGQYVEHFKSQPHPFTLNDAQAAARWHRDLADNTIKKSQKLYFNPVSKKDELFTRVHLNVDELEHRRDIQEHGKQLQKSATFKHPSEALNAELKGRQEAPLQAGTCALRVNVLFWL